MTSSFPLSVARGNTAVLVRTPDVRDFSHVSVFSFFDLSVSTTTASDSKAHVVQEVA